uniref:hypothetical protein n=1 Tax=Salibaculum sp. TaxID=2855480 RepID=UPI0038641D53
MTLLFLMAAAMPVAFMTAVVLPTLLGYLWMVLPAAVFGLAAGMAGMSLALLIPRHPGPGNETILTRVLPAPSE